ncbi:MAG: NAD(P)-dependent oxidoreductase [Ramlibacter sp.]|nr:NAD(P)-dependent oxidoreductase [Ramlibacter sp.]
MHIGIAGTGKMGAAIARRLLATGHQVSVWNRTAERAQPLLAEGARWAPTSAALAGEAATVITMLTDEAALDEVYFGTQGLLAGATGDHLFIDMSTVRPAKQQAMGARVRASGSRYLECPVGGSVGPAQQGKLLGFVGGAAPDLERARALLEVLCRRIEHVGELGAGATVKLAINLPLMVYWQTLSEALSLLQPLGLEPARVIDILADTSGGPNMLKARGPMIAQALAGDASGAVSVNVATMRKDLRSMLDQAALHNVRLPLAQRTLQSFEQAGAAGLDAADCTQLPVWWLGGAGRA